MSPSRPFARRIRAIATTSLAAALCLSGAAVSSQAAAPSRGTPAKATRPGVVSFPGNDGKAHTVTWDANSYKVDGERLNLWSGEFHPWRAPSHDAWRDIFQKMRASGFNAISVYFFWGLAQQTENGPFDFTGMNDIDALLTIAEEEGLYVIARPGPYINAEVSMGGMPAWQSNRAGALRNMANLEASNAWLHAFNQIAAKHQVTDGGGSVILYQIENELVDTNRTEFVKALVKQVKQDGITVPLFHNDYNLGGRYADVKKNDLDTWAYDQYPIGFNCSAARSQIQETEAAQRRYAPGIPNFIAEAQGGAFTPWGARFTPDQCARFVDPAFTRQWGVSNIGNGVTAFNYYMLYGGTNWGWTGSPSSGFTSYDYGAALNEDRTITPKLATMKQIGYYQQGVPELTSMEPVADPKAQTDGAKVKINARQAREGDSVTGNGTRYYGVRLADSNNTNTAQVHLPIVLNKASEGTETRFTADDRDPAVQYTGSWQQAADPSASEQTVTSSTTTGDKATYTFEGTGIEVITPTGTDHGVAKVTIDGKDAGEFTSWVSTNQNRPNKQVSFRTRNLAIGKHTITIEVTGRPAPKAPADNQGTRVAIDALNVIEPATPDTPQIVNASAETGVKPEGTWDQASGKDWTAGDYNGDELNNRQAKGDSLTFTFQGVGIEVIAPFSENHGPADVFIDGTLVGRTNEQNSSGARPQQISFSKKDLAQGEHTLKLVSTGEKFPGSSGSFVAVDAFRVYPTAASVTKGDDETIPEGVTGWTSVPQQGALTIHGRDAAMVTADKIVAGQKLLYTTSELFGAPVQTANGPVQYLDGHTGDGGETVFSMAPGYKVEAPAGVEQNYDAEKQQLRLNYTHGKAPVNVTITDKDGKRLTLRIMDREFAATVWLLPVAGAPKGTTVAVEGPELARAARMDGDKLALTGSVSESTPLNVLLPAAATSFTWNGATVATAPGPEAVKAPELRWVKSAESPETAAEFDDSTWIQAKDTKGSQSQQGPGRGGVVLDSNHYRQFEGSVWYRAHFTSDGTTGITLKGNGGSGVPGHGKNPAFLMVWANGQYLGARPATGSDQRFTLPQDVATDGKDVQLTVLVNNLGQNLDWSDDGLSRQNRGLYDAVLPAKDGTIAWKIKGSSEKPADTDRGLLNLGGLYGERAGWHLPGYPTKSWKAADSMHADGPGVTWYQSTVDLQTPEGQDVAYQLQIDSAAFKNGRTDKSQVQLFVNGWNTGVYIGDIGPQTNFTVPGGFLNLRGRNTITVAVIAKEQGAGPEAIRLVPVHSTTGAAGTFAPLKAPAHEPVTGDLKLTTKDTTEEDERPYVLEHNFQVPATQAGVLIDAVIKWGDGTRSQTVPLAEGARTVQAEHTITDSKAHTVTVTLKDRVSGEVLLVSTAQVPDTSAPQVAITASSAGTKPVGQWTAAWGTVTGVPAGTQVCTQVKIGSTWSTSQCGTTDAKGNYTLPLTYGATTPGTHTWRVTAAGRTSNEFTLTRTGYLITASAASTKPVGQWTATWGTVLGAPAGTKVCTQVKIGANWSTSQCGTTDAKGNYTLPLTYGATTPGLQTWRVNVDGSFSKEFTLLRTLR